MTSQLANVWCTEQTLRELGTNPGEIFCILLLALPRYRRICFNAHVTQQWHCNIGWFVACPDKGRPDTGGGANGKEVVGIALGQHIFRLDLLSTWLTCIMYYFIYFISLLTRLLNYWFVFKCICAWYVFICIYLYICMYNTQQIDKCVCVCFGKQLSIRRPLLKTWYDFHGMYHDCNKIIIFQMIMLTYYCFLMKYMKKFYFKHFSLDNYMISCFVFTQTSNN